jgi:hypothetical protein
MGAQDALAAQGAPAAELAGTPPLFPDAAPQAGLYTWGGLDPADEELLDQRYGALLSD